MVQAVDTSDTRLLASPAITEGKITFVYGDDIWVAGADGTGARRLTSHPGQERSPYFTPDGKHIAFTASYDGNVEVYVVPVEGGEPKRLTWHPGEDIVRGFTADGRVLFTSQRAVFSRRHSQFFTIGVDGGVPQALLVPPAIWVRSHRMDLTWPTRHSVSGSASGRTTAAARPRGSGCSNLRTSRTRRFPSPRESLFPGAGSLFSLDRWSGRSE